MSGRVLAVLGGANSIDRDLREPGTSWWPEESITADDLTVLGYEPADVLLGHQAPLNIPDLDREIEPARSWWPSSIIRYVDEGRHLFHQGVLAVRPALTVGGHYHCFVDQSVDYGEGDDAFRTRVVVLDQSGPKTIAQAVLDVNSLQLVFFHRGDTVAPGTERTVTAVDEFRAGDRGVWNVTTSESWYRLDLDAGTVQQCARGGIEPGGRTPAHQGFPALRGWTARVLVGASGRGRSRGQQDLAPYTRNRLHREGRRRCRPMTIRDRHACDSMARPRG